MPIDTFLVLYFGYLFQHRWRCFKDLVGPWKLVQITLIDKFEHVTIWLASCRTNCSSVPFHRNKGELKWVMVTIFLCSIFFASYNTNSHISFKNLPL